MRNHIDIDRTHSRAIAQEIGERLRMLLSVDQETPARFKMQIDRLRELDDRSPSIVPSAERWDKLRR